MNVVKKQTAARKGGRSEIGIAALGRCHDIDKL